MGAEGERGGGRHHGGGPTRGEGRGRDQDGVQAVCEEVHPARHRQPPGRPVQPLHGRRPGHHRQQGQPRHSAPRRQDQSKVNIVLQFMVFRSSVLSFICRFTHLQMPKRKYFTLINCICCYSCCYNYITCCLASETL